MGGTMSKDWLRRTAAICSGAWAVGAGNRKLHRAAIRLILVGGVSSLAWVVVAPGFGSPTPPPSPSWTCDASAVKVMTGGVVTADPLSANTNPIDGRCHP